MNFKKNKKYLNYLLISIITVLVFSIIGFSIIEFFYKDGDQVPFFYTIFSSSDILAFLGSVISLIGTIFLGIIAINQTHEGLNNEIESRRPALNFEIKNYKFAKNEDNNDYTIKIPYKLTFSEDSQMICKANEFAILFLIDKDISEEICKNNHKKRKIIKKQYIYRAINTIERNLSKETKDTEKNYSDTFTINNISFDDLKKSNSLMIKIKIIK